MLFHAFLLLFHGATAFAPVATPGRTLPRANAPIAPREVAPFQRPMLQAVLPMQPVFEERSSTVMVASNALFYSGLATLAAGMGMALRHSGAATTETEHMQMLAGVASEMRLDALSRRQTAQLASTLLLFGWPLVLPPAHAAEVKAPLPSPSAASCTPATSDFRSGASDQPNYANAVVASRDTNVSPKETYDVITRRAVPPPGVTRCPRALDLGAGAGVSTEILWRNGFRSIVAVDPSRVAWDKFVGEQPAGGVTFIQNSDEGYLASRPADAALFDLVLVNFAINADKARELLALLTPNGRLLAPVNQERDYWFKQEYRELDRAGELLWRTDTAGGWAILFQPDFTSPACQGQWCPQFRGMSDNTLKLQ